MITFSGKFFVFITIVCTGLLCILNAGVAQERTGATNSDFEVKKSEIPKSRKLLFIVRNDTRKILYGNKCFSDVQHSMGFEYIIQPKGQPLNRNELGRNLHNFGVKFLLIFRNGPFYGIKLKKRKRECRVSTGDFVG